MPMTRVPDGALGRTWVSDLLNVVKLLCHAQPPKLRVPILISWTASFLNHLTVNTILQNFNNIFCESTGPPFSGHRAAAKPS